MAEVKKRQWGGFRIVVVINIFEWKCAANFRSWGWHVLFGPIRIHAEKDFHEVIAD